MRADQVDPRKPFDFSLFWFDLDRPERPWEEGYLFTVEEIGNDEDDETQPEAITMKPATSELLKSAWRAAIHVTSAAVLVCALGAVIGFGFGVAWLVARWVADIS